MISINNEIRTYGIVEEFLNGRMKNYCNYFDACQIFVLFLNIFRFEVHWEQMVIYTQYDFEIFLVYIEAYEQV